MKRMGLWQLWERMTQLLRPYVEEKDCDLTDKEFIHKVYARWCKDNKEPILGWKNK